MSGRERPGALLARRTRTMKRCSFDARSKGQPWPLPLGRYGELEGPRLGQGASQGEESVLADSGRVGEITARVGRVRTETILSNPKNNSPTRHPQVALIFKPLAT
jgi:hypothetical protein